MVSEDQCYIQRREGVYPLLSSMESSSKGPEEAVISQAQVMCPFLSRLSTTAQWAVTKRQSKDAGQEGTMDSILVIEISPEQQRIGGNNLLLKIKDDDSYNTYQFLRTY